MGLALSDELRLTAQPLMVLERSNRGADLRRLREIVREHGVTLILIGNPLRLDGSSGPMAAEVARFAARVARETGLPVELADERLSSWEAGEVHQELGVSKKRKAAPADDIAAAIFLRDYLNRERDATPAKR
jgi:putative Holliday junction resolvase